MAAVIASLPLITGKRNLPDSVFDGTPVSKRRRTSSPNLVYDLVAEHRNGADDTTSTAPGTLITPSTPRSASAKGLKAPRPKNYICDFEGCNKAFNRPCRLDEHRRSHTNDRALKCPHEPCKKAFTRDNHLRAHIKSCHSNERNFVCDWEGCDKKFTSGQRLRRHIESHEKKETHRCKDYPPCDEAFRKHATLQKHIDTVHLHMKPHRCGHLDGETGKQCHANFTLASELYCHEADVHGAARYWCSFCPSGETAVGFGTYHDLQRHIAIAHPPFCTHCGLVCSTTSEVRQHVEIHHKGSTLEERRKFTCDYPGCGKSFTKKGNLNIHVKGVHSVEKPYKCGIAELGGTPGLEEWDPVNFCNASYTSKQTLVNHIKKHHLPGSVPKKVRKAQKSSRAPRVTASNALSLLTGIGTSSVDALNYVHCIVTGCTFRFHGRKSLEKHAHIAHGMTSDEVSEAILEREALSGGKFWIGGDCEDEEGADGDELDDNGEDDFTGLDREAVQIGNF